MPVAAVNGIDVYYERRGTGGRLLFFNGSTATLDSMRTMIDPFAARFDVLAHDQRGLGRTSIPAGPYEMADYAADAAALLDHVGWEHCRVVGVSFGGMVAQEFAVTWPQRVERLALLCTSPGGPYPPRSLGASADDGAIEAFDPSSLDTRFTPEYLETHEDARNFATAVSRMRSSDVPAEVRRGEAEQLGARSRHDVYDRLGAIACPTLVASGRYDGISPMENGEAIAERVPRAELRVYEGGHTFFVQDPTVIPEVVEFLASDD